MEKLILPLPHIFLALVRITQKVEQAKEAVYVLSSLGLSDQMLIVV